MAQTDKVYARHIHKHQDYFAAWNPTREFELGDYGEIRNKVFKRLGNIRQLGVKFGERKAGTGKSVQAVTKGGLKISLDVTGKDAKKKTQTKGNVKLDFKKKNAVFFKAQDLSHSEINNLHKVGDALIHLKKKKKWKLSYVVVTELVRAGHYLALISTRSDGRVSLSGKTPIKGKGVTVGQLDLKGLSVQSSSSGIESFEDHDGGTPLFQLHTVKDPITKKAFFTEYK